MNPSERRATASKPRTGVKKAVPTKAVKPAATARRIAAPAKKAASPQPFGFDAAKSTRSVSAASLLGLLKENEEGRLFTWMEWVEQIRHGVPSAAVDSLIGFLSITKSELSDAIDIPFRTLVRRKGEALLDSDESAKLVRVARVIERAEEVFESPDAARGWLKSPNASLSGQTPMSLLDTEIGAESVLDTLGRIEHGIFA